MNALETINVNSNVSIWMDLTDATVHLATSWMAFQMTIQPTALVSIIESGHFSNVTNVITQPVGYGTLFRDCSGVSYTFFAK